MLIVWMWLCIVSFLFSFVFSYRYNRIFHEYHIYAIGFNHGLPCYVKNMARGTQVDKNRGRRPRFLSWLRPEGHVFNIAWQAMIKTYYSMFPLWFNWSFSTKMWEIVELRVLWSAPDLVARQNRLLLWVGCLATYINWKLCVHSSLWYSGC